MSDVILYSGNAFSVADGKGRFVLPLEMRKLVRQASGDENRLCLSVHMDNGCATGFGLSHKRFLFDEVAELERLAREANRPFNGDLERENRLGTIEDVNFDDGARSSSTPISRKKRASPTWRFSMAWAAISRSGSPKPLWKAPIARR